MAIWFYDYHGVLLAVIECPMPGPIMVELVRRRSGVWRAFGDGCRWHVRPFKGDVWF